MRSIIQHSVSLALIAGLFGLQPLQALALEFSGYTWGVFGSNRAGARAPGPNRFSPDSVFVDEQGRLHLTIEKRNDGYWWASEVNVKRVLGYGTYTIFMDSPLYELNHNAVFGFFTWDVRQGGETHREWDIEFSRWGSRLNWNNGYFTVQPYDAEGHQSKFRMKDSDGGSVHEVRWTAGSLEFRSWLTREDYEAGHVYHVWEFHGDAVPDSARERLRMNLWFYRGETPSGDETQEVIIKEFNFREE